MQSDEKRIDYIDFTKGVAILLVVWGHAIQVGGMQREIFSDKLFTFIYSFHMPLFMMLSGFVFTKTCHKMNFCKNVKSKITRLVFPAVFWGVLFYIIKVVIENYLLKKSFTFSIQQMIQEIWNVWFLWSLFFCTVAALIAEKITKRIVRIFVYLLSFIILYYLPNGEFSVFLFPYFIIGYILGKRESIPVKYCCLCLVMFPVLLMYYSKEHFIYVSGIARVCEDLGFGRQIIIDIFRWGIGLVGSISAITIVKLVLKNLSSESRLKKIFCELGKYTLEIYVMQRILVEYMGAKVMWKIVNEMNISILSNQIVYDYIFTFVFTILFVFILYNMAVIYRKFIKNLNSHLHKI